jgi:hypothetical protein
MIPHFGHLFDRYAQRPGAISIPKRMPDTALYGNLGAISMGSMHESWRTASIDGRGVPGIRQGRGAGAQLLSA